MHLSREGKIISGIFLILTTTIMYGGYTLLGFLTKGAAGGAHESLVLDETQYALWRAGHAHAGVYVILGLVIQPLVDQTELSKSWKWVARLGAPVASIVVPVGFFGLAFFSFFKWIMFVGIVCLAGSMLLTGIGLLKNLRVVEPLNLELLIKNKPLCLAAWGTFCPYN